MEPPPARLKRGWCIAGGTGSLFLVRLPFATRCHSRVLVPDAICGAVVTAGGFKQRLKPGCCEVWAWLHAGAMLLESKYAARRIAWAMQMTQECDEVVRLRLRLPSASAGSEQLSPVCICAVLTQHSKAKPGLEIIYAVRCLENPSPGPRPIPMPSTSQSILCPFPAQRRPFYACPLTRQGGAETTG